MKHLLIIWSKASAFRDQIITDIKTRFPVRNVFRVHWVKDVFEANLKVFYAHSQKHLDEYSYHDLLVNKMAHCGIGEFWVILFEDKTPQMEIRSTSSGAALVNVNVFDLKNEYRSLTGGGHKIHASNDEWETNKDLTVLFGRNLEDFYNLYPPDYGNVFEYANNCCGVGGFDSIKQLFYLLNNTITYCILRNHECLPDQYNVEGHGDIDLLVEHKNYIKYLTQARDVFGVSYRVYHTIRISGEEIPFDFRYLGDNYYDNEWEKDILRTRKLSPKGFYIPNEENQFYSLLYHAYIQKPNVADDYIEKLSNYSNAIGLSFDATASNAVRSLDSFFEKNNYDYLRPSDRTVFYNEANLAMSQRIMSFGWPVSKNVQGENATVPYFSVVYERENSFYKRGSSFLIKNEVRFLNTLSEYDFFPKVLATGKDDYGAYMEISRIPGKSFASFFSNKKNNTSSMVRCFMRGIARILRIMIENDILHRDMIPQNILVEVTGQKCSVSLIDFGWAIDISKKDDCLKPEGLADIYGPKNGYSDFYNIGAVIEKQWAYWVPYIKRISCLMKSIVWEDYGYVWRLKDKLDEIDKLIARRFSLFDRVGLYVLRHKSIIRFWVVTKRRVKKVKSRLSKTSKSVFGRFYRKVLKNRICL